MKFIRLATSFLYATYLTHSLFIFLQHFSFTFFSSFLLLLIHLQCCLLVFSYILSISKYNCA
jgi:hypothetical protein